MYFKYNNIIEAPQKNNQEDMNNYVIHIPF